MKKHSEITKQLVFEVLTGELQQRYAETGSIQFHPNYTPLPNIPREAPFGTARDTKRAIQAAFLIRWANSLGNNDLEDIDESEDVPSLVDLNGEPLQYGALDSVKTFKLLCSLGLIESPGDLILPTSKTKKVISRNPTQSPTIMPRSGIFGVKQSLREGIRVHRLYNELEYGKGVDVPMGLTSRFSSADRNRRGFRVVENED